MVKHYTFTKVEAITNTHWAVTPVGRKDHIAQIEIVRGVPVITFLWTCPSMTSEQLDEISKYMKGLE